MKAGAPRWTGDRPPGFYARIVPPEGSGSAADRRPVFFAGPAVRGFDLADVTPALPEGRHTLEVVAVDGYGTASEPATVEVAVGAGGVPAAALADAFDLYAEAGPGGSAVVGWTVRLRASGVVYPQGWEVAGPEGDDAVLMLVLVPAGQRPVVFDGVAVPAGFAAEAEAAVLRLRAVGDGAERGPWQDLPPVVVDATAPSVPRLVC